MGLFNQWKKKREQQKSTEEKAQTAENIRQQAKEQNESVDYLNKLKEQRDILNDNTKSLDERNAANLAIRNEEERRLNEAYDFNSIEGINSIPVPCQEVNEFITGRVEYYLRGKCFAEHYDADRMELALACLRKAQELMFVSNVGWQRKDFLKLVVYLYEIGEDEEAEVQLAKIDKFLKKQDIHQKYLSQELNLAQELETDLMETYSSAPYCKECAKYINRVYSISGRNKQFPSFMQARKECLHELKCLSFSPFFLFRKPSFECQNIVQYSNRPFIDERSDDEIKRYDEWITMMQHKQEEEKRMIEYAKTKRQDIQSLNWLQENLPTIAPKSLSGFRRMRSTNSKNYQKLVNEAAKLGKVL
jgi:hypothetical protein